MRLLQRQYRLVDGIQITSLFITTLELRNVVQGPKTSQRSEIDFSEDSVIAEPMTAKHQPPKKVQEIDVHSFPNVVNEAQPTRQVAVGL